MYSEYKNYFLFVRDCSSKDLGFCFLFPPPLHFPSRSHFLTSSESNGDGKTVPSSLVSDGVDFVLLSTSLKSFLKDPQSPRADHSLRPPSSRDVLGPSSLTTTGFAVEVSPQRSSPYNRILTNLQTTSNGIPGPCPSKKSQRTL